MSSNLDKLFKSHTNLEKDGVWFEIADGIRFRVRRFGGSNFEVKKAMAKHYKPYSKLIERNLLSEEKEREIYTKAFIDSCIVDWEGVEVDSVKTPFSFDAALTLFKGLPELLETLMEHSQSTDNYREDLGN